MPGGQPITIEPVTKQRSAVSLPACAHRFDVVCLDGQFILDLWECRYCGQRIRRKKHLATVNQAGSIGVDGIS
jgi:hypothetical protein